MRTGALALAGAGAGTMWSTAPPLLLAKLRKTIAERADCGSPTSPLLDEKIYFLVCQTQNWNPFLICTASIVCKQFATMSKTVLWKEFCLSRAPKMVADLLLGSKHGGIEGGWEALGKLMFYCPGTKETRNFKARVVAGHFARQTRFSKTSGKSFLPVACRNDTLYVSDGCEHMDEVDDDDVGVFRGIFKTFRSSKTRAMLVEKCAQLEQNVYCPFCKSRVWSMRDAKMLPGSASKKMGAYDDNIDSFVCPNGHMHGMCSLINPDDLAADGSLGVDKRTHAVHVAIGANETVDIVIIRTHLLGGTARQHFGITHAPHPGLTEGAVDVLLQLRTLFNQHCPGFGASECFKNTSEHTHIVVIHLIHVLTTIRYIERVIPAGYRQEAFAGRFREPGLPSKMASHDSCLEIARLFGPWAVEHQLAECFPAAFDASVFAAK
eukprot:TRINITY_DN7380_c0_g2_i1.p1 TRINITY_DN7380_c0_g2~~TRINITY_DN7380_c0_g2_i1.p1  ORF type:complete len:436 (-),score=45.26 TRINITY_DN7380_c0_g2_i1:301-1608(-)